MNEATCKTCPCFDKTAGYESGPCRRNAPIAVLMHWPETGGEYIETVWPNVASGDWCGEHPERKAPS